MADFIFLEDKTVTTGGTINIPASFAAGYPECLNHGYRLTGTVTLTSDYELTPDGTAVANQRVVFINQASITLDGNDFVIFGEIVPTQLAAKGFIAECWYSGSAWKVIISPSFSNTQFIENTHIKDTTLTLSKLAALTRGDLISAQGAGGVPTALTLGAASRFLSSNGTDVLWVALAGDGTLSGGTLTIANDAISNAKLANMNANTIKVRDANTSGDPSDKALADTQILIGNGAGFTAAAISNDASMTNAGVLTNTSKEVHQFSFEGINAATLGDYKWFPNFNGSITKVYVLSDGTIEATDALTVNPKNNAGTSMVAAVISLAAGSTIGNSASTTALTNNTFVSGDTITFTIAKTTVGANTKGRVIFWVTRSV